MSLTLDVKMIAELKALEDGVLAPIVGGGLKAPGNYSDSEGDQSDEHEAASPARGSAAGRSPTRLGTSSPSRVKDSPDRNRDLEEDVGDTGPIGVVSRARLSSGGAGYDSAGDQQNAVVDEDVAGEEKNDDEIFEREGNEQVGPGTPLQARAAALPATMENHEQQHAAEGEGGNL